MGNYNSIGGILGGTAAIGRQAQAMTMCSAPPPAVDVREVDAESSILTIAMSDLADRIHDLESRLVPVLRQIPTGDSQGKVSDSRSSPLGQYLAERRSCRGT